MAGSEQPEREYEYKPWEFKPGDFGPWGLRFLKAFLAVGITVPTLLCAYGIITYLRGRL